MNKKLFESGLMTLATLLVCSCSNKANSDSEIKDSDSTSTSENEVIEGNGNKCAYKDETVYVITKNTGEANKIIVEDWLKNTNNEEIIADYSSLTNIYNVKGDEIFNNDNGNLKWLSKGNDIHYQGLSNKELPVEMNVTYTLDNQAISPDNLGGKTGHLSINYTFTNNTLSANGYVPFLALSGMILDNETFKNISIDSGKIIRESSKSIVIGYAFPGLKEDLGLNGIDLPISNEFSFEADVTDFSLETTLTVVDNSLLQSLVESINVDTSTDEFMQQIYQFVLSLNNQTSTIYDSYLNILEKENELKDGLNNLSAGVDALSAGMKELSDGLGALTENNEALLEGATLTFNTFLAQANDKLSTSSLSLPQLTIDNYQTVLDQAIASLSKENVEIQVKDGIKQQVTLGYKKSITEAVLSSLGMSYTYEQYVQACENGLVSQENQNAIEATVNAKLNEEDTQTAIDLKTTQTYESSEGQAILNAKLQEANQGKASLEELKTSLDSYNTFYTGLKEYLTGVENCKNGALTIYNNISTLVEGVDTLKESILNVLNKVDGVSSNLTKDDFDKVQSLIDLYKENQDFHNNLEKTIELTKNYKNYSGSLENQDGQVKFIYRSEPIK